MPGSAARRGSYSVRSYWAAFRNMPARPGRGGATKDSSESAKNMHLQMEACKQERGEGGHKATATIQAGRLRIAVMESGK